LSVKFSGLDIAELSRLPLKRLDEIAKRSPAEIVADHPEKALVVERIVDDLRARLAVLLDLGLGYLTLERSTLSPGELQRLRLATQVRSNLFGVVYVLDEPSAGLHPADTEALLRAFQRLKAAGHSLFVVEHELDVVRQAAWVVDVGPETGEKGGRILYSGPLKGLADVRESQTRRFLFGAEKEAVRSRREASGWLKLRGVTRNNLHRLDVDFPLGVFTCVTGISGSGKSSLVSQFLVETVGAELGHQRELDATDDVLEVAVETLGGAIVDGLDQVRRLVVVDQKPIGRTPRSNLATYTGLLDHVRRLCAATKQARARKYDAGRFSFNVAKGRCETCQGEGYVCVELRFLPSVYVPCPTCKGARYNAKTLEIKIRDKSIADVLAMNVDAAFAFFADDEALRRSLGVLREVGLGYIRLGQPATELSGGEAQRVKVATELQRAQRGGTLYVLDEPTTGLHPADVAKLMKQLDGLGGGREYRGRHRARYVGCGKQRLDCGCGARSWRGGGRLVVAGKPSEVASNAISRTAKYLATALI
jgi:excinuclease ABC subunit A